MKCSEIEEILAEYSVGALDASSAEAVEAHLAECAECRAELEILEAAGALLGPVEMVDAPEGLWTSIEARLEPRERAHPARHWLWKPAIGLAASLLLVVVFVSPALRSPNSPGITPVQMAVVSAGEGTVFAETQLVAAWEQPLADEASLGLAMAVLEPDGNDVDLFGNSQADDTSGLNTSGAGEVVQ